MTYLDPFLQKTCMRPEYFFFFARVCCFHLENDMVTITFRVSEHGCWNETDYLLNEENGYNLSSFIFCSYYSTFYVPGACFLRRYNGPQTKLWSSDCEKRHDGMRTFICKYQNCLVISNLCNLFIALSCRLWMHTECGFEILDRLCFQCLG